MDELKTFLIYIIQNRCYFKIIKKFFSQMKLLSEKSHIPLVLGKS